MRHKLILGLIGFWLVATLTIPAHASYSISEGIDGYVYGNGMPVEGIYVHVYNASDMHEGYGVNPDNSQGMPGVDITDADGYFHIAWLAGYGNTYKVVAETPVGDLVQYVQVNCGQTTRVCFNYSYGAEPFTMGYWKNHPEAWPVTSLEIGGITYTQEQLLWILENANAKDATCMLAAQLIAAKLNVANGASSPSISDTIDDADMFLMSHPLGSDPRGADRSYALELKDALDYFNNGY